MEELAPFMLTKAYKIPKRTHCYNIKRHDSLFWCFFAMKYGFASYETPGNVSFTNEKEEKYKCINYIKANKELLKSYKINNKDNGIENDLANNTCISEKTFISLCIINEIKILFIQKMKAFWWSDEISFVVKDNGKFVSILFDQDEQTIMANYYRWENIEKPIKCCVSFKRDQLYELCCKLKLNTTTAVKQTKRELYNLIIEAIL